MPDLQEQLYCSEQIHVPPTFPYLMKLYCKAAIRTQPYDLLKWSAAYFRALANGEEPPVKERLEYPPYDSPSGLTPGYIKILIKQFGKSLTTIVSAQTLFQKWSDICLDEWLLVKLIALMGANTVVTWVNFVGVCAGFISKNLTQTMILVCELFTDEPEGGMASIPYDLFVDVYTYLARMECGPLTDKETKELQEIMFEEDICDVVEKIKQGQYEGEEEGEAPYGVEVKVAPEVEGEEGEQVKTEEETQKGSEEISYQSEEMTKEGEVYPEKSEEDKEGEMELEPSTEAEEEGKAGEKSASKEASSKSVEEDEEEEFDNSDEDVSVEGTPSFVEDLEAESEESVTQAAADGQGPPPAAEEKKDSKKINLEDLDEAIRRRIEEKLQAEAESTEADEREFEELGNYVLGAAARVTKFTAEALGFKIFRKYMRQEVPGIGPAVDPVQVEKVIDFMDAWSNKQENMVMPRNVRHWMCPTLDKIPTPEP